MYALLVVLVGVVGRFPFGQGAVHKCDPKFISEIKQFQCEHGRPGELIKTAVGNKPEVVGEVSSGYLPDDVMCLATVYTPLKNRSAVITRFYYLKDNTTTIENRTAHEDCGTLWQSVGQLWRYHVYLRSDVTLVHLCSDADDATVGPPVFVIKTGKASFSSANIAKGRRALEKLGYYKDMQNIEQRCAAYYRSLDTE